MTYLILGLICASLYSIKGGWHKPWRIYLEHKAGIEHDADGQVFGDMSIPQFIVHSLLDGKVASTILYGLLIWALPVSANPVFCALFWLLAVSPSMGEDVGAVGGYRGGWGPYIDKGFGRMYGVKKCLQRGVFMGFVLGLPFWDIGFGLAGALLPIIAFISISIEQYRTGIVKASWHLHEPLIGFALGLALAHVL